MTDQIPSSIWRELVVNSTSMRVNFRSNVVRVANMDTQKVGVQTIVTRGPANTGFWLVPGDGSSPKWVQHVGTGTDVTTTHTYTGAGTKYQKWVGDLGQITFIQLSSESYCFDVTNIEKFIGLIYVNLSGNTNVIGTLSNIPSNIATINFAILSNIYMSLADLPSTINNLNINGCSNVSGTTATIATWGPNFGELWMPNTNITGDIKDIAALSNLSSAYLSTAGTLLSYTSTTLPQWNNVIINFSSCGLSTAEIDALIYDLYNTPIKTGGSVNLAGTNDPRTTGAPNDTVYLPALTAAGCPVTSNPGI